MPSRDEDKKKIHEFEKKIRLLERKLNQDNLSRLLIEEAHDRYQNIYKHVLLELTEQKNELETAKNILDERTIELESANLQLKISKEKAEQSDKFKSEFLANMSHEIRTPMNAIIGYLSLLVKTELSSIQSEYIEEIKIASELMLFLVNDILDLSKIESGKMTFENINFDLKKIITESISLNIPRALQKGILLDMNYDDTIPPILNGDPMRIKQVLNNLITNAVKFTEKGGVTIKAAYTGSFGNRDKIFIAVSDTGSGIRDDEKDSLFEPFKQSRSIVHDPTEGTGLGLSISRKILNLMGSDIYVDSTIGKGSTFYFDLLLEKNSSDLKEQDDDQPEEKSIKKDITILIAEDNKTSFKLLSRIIDSLGLEADYAANGSEAVKKSYDKAYSLIFMDNIMPEKSGDEASIEIRKSGKSRNAVIIGFTAGIMNEEKVKLLNSGMNDFLVKPVKHNDVKKILIKYFQARP